MTDLDPRAAHLHHLLLVDADVTHDDVEALVRSHYPQSGWVAADAMALEVDVELTGPWAVGTAVRRQMDAPAWLEQAYLAVCPQERSGELPEALKGLDPIMDAYPFATPQGRELRTLTFLHAAARRLGGAVHLAGTAVLLQPDPESAVDLTVYAPAYAEVEPARAAIGRDDVVLDGRTRRSWSLSMPAAAGRIRVVSERHPMPPLALAGLPWVAPGARGYEVRWIEPDTYSTRGGRLSISQRRVRSGVTSEIERIAGAIAELTGGVAVDDDGFIVALAGGGDGATIGG